MFTVKSTKKSTIVYANNFVVGVGYKRMLILAEAYGGKVDTDKKSKLAKITFGDPISANEFVAQFTQEYTKAHKAYTKQTKSADNSKSKKTPSSSKKITKSKKANKMTLDDFIISKPDCSKDEAKAYGFKGTRADLRARKKELGVR